MNHRPLRWSAVTLGALSAGVAYAVAPSPATPAVAPAAVVRPAASSAEPPPVDVQVLRHGTAPGLLFIDPQALNATTTPRGPLIIDDHGRVVWFHSIPLGDFATCFRVQTYQGRKVLTWWQGSADNTGAGAGVGYIADDHYRIIATVRSDAGPFDLHEFRITPQGTALVTGHRPVHMDLSSINGPKDATVIDSIIQEVDVATGKVLLDWHSVDHVPVAETDLPLSPSSQQAIDYFHVNSVALDTDGDLLISARHTSTVYKVDRKAGTIVWRLGGRHSDFRLGVGARFSWQHDAEPEGHDTYRIFDNEARDGFQGYESRVVWVRIDPKRHTASYVRQDIHPQPISTVVEGGSDRASNGDTVMSWGSESRISEFSPRGALLFDAALPDGFSTYRAYRSVWNGRPNTAPEITADSGTVHVVWNGATGVARWRILAGDSATSLRPTTDAPWNGMNTTVKLPSGTAAHYVQAQALDTSGKVLGTSPVTPVDS